MNNTFADTRLIGFWGTFSTMLLGPIIALVYAAYSLAYWMKAQGWTEGWMRGVSYPYITLFLILNTLHNWFVCTVLFRELPKEFLTTSRLKRMKTSIDPWRREMADMFGGFLNSQDDNHY